MTTGSDPATGFASLRSRLRTETRVAHRRLETRLDLLGRSTDRARIRNLLLRFFGFHAVWEPALALALDDPGFVAAHTKLGALRDDLHRLGIAPAALDRVARCTFAQRLTATPAATLGALYVVEGSTLGGRLIERELGTRAWWPAGGLRYFTVYGEQTAARWHETIAHIGNVPRTQHDAIVCGAETAFETLEKWLVVLHGTDPVVGHDLEGAAG